jgi:hypothetical protein
MNVSASQPEGMGTRTTCANKELYALTGHLPSESVRGMSTGDYIRDCEDSP